jgi:hypothetical protein
MRGFWCARALIDTKAAALVIRLRAGPSFPEKLRQLRRKIFRKKGAGSICCGALPKFDNRRIRGKF